MNETKLTPRKLANKIKRELAEVERQKNQKPVKEMTITLEWKKSMYGFCPTAEAAISFHDGTFLRTDKRYYAGGCGYDKESTVISQIFNDYLRYKLYQKHKWKDRINQETTNFPYGVYYYDGSTEKQRDDGYIGKPSFNYGVGTSCYYKIAEFIGGTFENVANGKHFGVFKYTDKV